MDMIIYHSGVHDFRDPDSKTFKPTRLQESHSRVLNIFCIIGHQGRSVQSFELLGSS